MTHRLRAVQAAVQAVARGVMAVRLGAVQTGHMTQVQIQIEAMYSPAAAAAQCNLQGSPGVLPALYRVLYRLVQQYPRRCTQAQLGSVQ
jgi:predicted nucleic acid-binding Zn ribbon protein